MRTAKYDKKITIQKGTKVENDIGGFAMSWSDLYDWHVSLTPLTGLKRFEFSRLAYTEAYEVEGRRRATDPDGDCQVIFEGRVFQIASLQHDTEKTYMVISR